MLSTGMSTEVSTHRSWNLSVMQTKNPGMKISWLLPNKWKLKDSLTWNIEWHNCLNCNCRYHATDSVSCSESKNVKQQKSLGYNFFSHSYNKKRVKRRLLLSLESRFIAFLSLFLSLINTARAGRFKPIFIRCLLKRDMKSKEKDGQDWLLLLIPTEQVKSLCFQSIFLSSKSILESDTKKKENSKKNQD